MAPFDGLYHRIRCGARLYMTLLPSCEISVSVLCFDSWKSVIGTVLSAKSDNDVMFCLQHY